jgi:hypothetical protein
MLRNRHTFLIWVSLSGDRVHCLLQFAITPQRFAGKYFRLLLAVLLLLGAVCFAETSVNFYRNKLDVYRKIGILFNILSIWHATTLRRRVGQMEVKLLASMNSPVYGGRWSDSHSVYPIFFSLDGLSFLYLTMTANAMAGETLWGVSLFGDLSRHLPWIGK